MENPKNLKYTQDHEWVANEDGKVKIGVSAHAVEQLGDIVHMELPAVGDKLSSGDSFGTIESTKTVSDLYSPCNGTITAINEKVMNDPESLAADPYNEGWLVEVTVDGDLSSDLMDSKQYEDYLTSQA